MLAAVESVSLAAAGLGLGGVGILFLLHHLRSLPKRQTVATLLFWNTAARQHQARVSWSRRFTHLRTFLLLSTIVLLLAAAMVADRWGLRSDRVDVVVIDIGTSMAAPAADGRSLLAAARAGVEADLGRIGTSPALITAGSQPLQLCQPQSPEAVFVQKLNGLALTDTASGSGLALELAASVIGPSEGLIYWYTDQATAPAGLPAQVAARVRLRRSTPAGNAIAIRGVVFDPMPNDPARGTLRVRLSATPRSPVQLEAVTDHATHRFGPLVQTVSGDDIRFDDVPADGSIVTLTLTDAPGSPAEHRVSFQLPKRTPIRFCITDPVPSPLRMALATVGTETDSPDGAVVVMNSDRPLPAGAVGGIVIVGSSDRPPPAAPIKVAPGTAAWLGPIDFEHAGAAAADGIPASARPVLTAGGAAVMAIDVSPPKRRLYVSRSIIDESAELPRRAVFPVLMFRMASFLVDRQDARPVVTALRAVQDPLWHQTGEIGERPGVEIAYDAAAAGDAMGSSGLNPEQRQPQKRRRWPWAELLLASATGLLVVEGFLLGAKKIV